MGVQAPSPEYALLVLGPLDFAARSHVRHQPETMVESSRPLHPETIVCHNVVTALLEWQCDPLGMLHAKPVRDAG
jgi:hypothetical protein